MVDSPPPRNDLQMLKDRGNPVSRSISQMKLITRFTKIEGLRELMDLTYFRGPSSFHQYYRSPRRVFSNLGIPKEIFFLLDVEMIFVEQLAAMVATSPKEKNRGMIGTARSLIPSSTYCTFHQAALGAIESGYFPLPDVFVAPSFICEETVALYAYLGKRHNRPVFYVDCPNETDEAAEIYLADELEQLALNLADLFHIEIRQDQIEQVFRCSNEARKWWLRYQDMRSRLRTDSSDVTFQTILLSNLLYSKYGLEETIEVTRRCYEELGKRVEDEEAAEPARDIRVLWIHLLPYQASSASSLINLLKGLKVNVAADLVS